MKKILLVLCCLGLVGCVTSSPSFFVNVDSINRNNIVAGTKYMIVSGNKDVKQDDLQFLEFSSYIKRALLLNKFELVKDVTKADVLIFLNYGIGEPEELHFTYSRPIYGQTGVASSNTFANISTFGNMATGSATTTYTPSYGVVGSSLHSGTIISYTRFFALKAVDAKQVINNEELSELWATKVISTGSSDDLRRVFPVMVAAAKPYFAKNTGRKIEVHINEGDDGVREIKGDEYLKPVVPKDKIGFYEVDYKDEIKGVGVLCRANFAYNGLILFISLKNNTNHPINFDFDKLFVNYGNVKLYKFSKSEEVNRLLEKGTKEDMKNGLKYSDQNYLESHEIKPNDSYVGYVYFFEPPEILDGDKIEVEFEINNSKTIIPFEYKAGWMTRKLFIEKFKEK